MLKLFRGSKPSSFPAHELRDSSKALFANISFFELERKTKSIVITSTAPNEGKTTVSTNLAYAAAASGKKVLLIDADIRQRSVAEHLGIRARFGLAAVLFKKVPIERAIVPTGHRGLYFLDSEPGAEGLADAFSTKSFHLLIEELTKRFDYVFVDTPPIGTFIDAAVVARAADASLLVVRERFSKSEDILRSVQQLKVANERILGSVITFSSKKPSGYYYYAGKPRMKNIEKIEGQSGLDH